MPADEGSEAGGGGGQDNPAFCPDEDGASSCANSNSTASVGADSGADNKSETKIEMGDETDTAPKSKLNGVNGKSKSGDVSFLNSTVASNGSANDASDKKEQVEAVNLELVSMKPYNGSNNGQTKNQEACELPTDPYEEYFVPVNEHRKYMRSTEREVETTIAGVRFDLGPGVGREGLSLRDPAAGLVDYSHWLTALRGEKLYVTKDKRSTGSYWKRVLCWGFGFFIIAVAAIFVILIATGIIQTREGTKPLLNGDKITSRHLDVTQESKNREYMKNPPPSPPPIISTPSSWPTTDETFYKFVPKALDGLVTLYDLEWSPAMDDPQSRVYRDVAKEIESGLVNILRFNNNSPSIKVYAISKNGDVKFRMNQPIYEKPEDSQSYLEKKFQQNGNAIGKYHVKKLQINALIDHCQSKDFECSDGCAYDYVEGTFKCVCTEGKILDKSGKKCLDEGGTFDVQGRSKSRDDEYHSIHNTKWGGYYDLPTIEPESDLESLAEPTSEPKAFPEPTSELKPSAEPKNKPDSSSLPIAEPEPESEPEPPAQPTIGARPFEPQSAPEPSAEPKSEPEPHAEPTAHTEPSSEPTSVPEPSAEPKSEPEPSAEPESEPESSAEPTKEPKLFSVPASEPQPSSEPKSEAEPSAEPTSHAEPSTEPAGEPEPAAEPKSEPEPSVELTSHAKPSAEPTSEPETSAEPKSEPEPSVEPTNHAEPSAEPASEAEPAVEPKSEPESSLQPTNHAEPSAEPAGEPEPSAEPKSEPEPSVEPTSHAKPSAEPASKPEPSAEPKSEPEPSVEPTSHVEPSAEPASEPEPSAEPKSEPEPSVEPTSHAEPSAEPTNEAEPAAEPKSKPDPSAEPSSEPEPSAEPTSEPGPASGDEKGPEHPIKSESDSNSIALSPVATSTSEPPTVIGLRKNIEITTESQGLRTEHQGSNQSDQLLMLNKKEEDLGTFRPFFKRPQQKSDQRKNGNPNTVSVNGSENNEEAYNDITDDSFPEELGKNSVQPSKNLKKDEKRLQKTYRQHKITDHTISQVLVNKLPESTSVSSDKHSEDVSITSQVPILPIEIQMDITTETDEKIDSITTTQELEKVTMSSVNSLKTSYSDSKTTAQIPILPDEIQTTDDNKQEQHTESTVNYRVEKRIDGMSSSDKNDSANQNMSPLETTTGVSQKKSDPMKQDVLNSEMKTFEENVHIRANKTMPTYDVLAVDPNAENDIKPVTENISGDTQEMPSYQFTISSTEKAASQSNSEELDEAQLRVVPLNEKEKFEELHKSTEKQVSVKKDEGVSLNRTAKEKNPPRTISEVAEDNDTEDVPLKTIYILSSFNGSDTPQPVTTRDEMTTIMSHVDKRKLIPVSEEIDDTYQFTEPTISMPINDQQASSADSQKFNALGKDGLTHDTEADNRDHSKIKDIDHLNSEPILKSQPVLTTNQSQYTSSRPLNISANEDPQKTSPTAVFVNTSSEIFFSKCKSGQFQCINGTSRDGAYCVSLSAKCDSENDCSDGSDEMNCREDGCPGNFQCASGQCLKRHLVCNGIVDCDDGSDEKECEKWTCKFDEFQCPNGRCIPSLWQCNGRPDCENHADEYSCSESCGNDEYLCPTERWCIPQTWRCNGVSECLNGDDEKLCDCAIDQFRCGAGGCIPTEQMCDGVENCPDKSDEWNCLGGFNKNSSISIETDKDSKEDEFSTRSSLIRIKQSNGEYRFICSDRWLEDFSDQYCKTLGFASSETTHFVDQGTNQNLLQLTMNANLNSSLVTNLEKVASCISKKIVEVSCREFTCGSHENVGPTARLVGGTPASEGQWSSVALLKEPKYGAACTASVLSPLHALASYSCIYSHRQSNGWQLFVGGNLLKPHKVKNIVPYPQVKYNQFLYNNDIAFVELEEPLTFSRNVSAVCLPSQSLQPRQLCVTAGWGFPVNGEVDLQQYLKFLPVPTYDSEECNATSHYAGFITKNNICAGFTDTDKGPCYNDEGAPLMCVSESGRWEIQGLLSHHSRCSRGHPAIYSSLTPVLSWLRNSIPALQSSS